MKNRISTRINFFLSTIFCIAAIIASHSAMAATYYVATGGSDSNPGTQAQPFRTIQKAANTVVAGDTVLVRAGSYVEEINLRTSGTASAKITFKPEPGTGTVFLKHPSTVKPNNTAVFQAFDIGHNRIEGFYFKDGTTDKQIQFYTTNQNVDFISVQTPTVGNEIVNNTFENVGNDGTAGAAYLGAISITFAKDCLIAGNTLIGVYGMGITPYGTYQCTIRGNTIRNMKGAVHYGDSWYPKNAHGIWLAGGIMGDGGWAPGNPGRRAGYNIIEDNVIDGSDGNETSGLRCDTGGHNNTWQRNIVKNLKSITSAGIFMESSCAGNTINENIVAYSNRGFDTSSPHIDWAQYNTWINNVAYNNVVGFAIRKTRLSNWKNNISFNNTRSQVIVTSQAAGNNNRFSNNLWFKTGSSNVGIYHGAGEDCIDSTTTSDCIDNRSDNLTLSQWNAASGETNSISATPQFVSLTSGAENFHLQASSPAIGKGENGVDIGAYPITSSSSSSSPPQPEPLSSSERTAETAAGSKTIDASASDWSGIPSYPIGEVCPTCVPPVTSDLAATFRVAWDSTYVYVLAEVNDNEVDMTGGSEIYENDGIEVMIDGLRDRALSYGSDDHQIFIRADGLTAAAGHNPGDGKVTAAARQVFGGYIIEAAIRWDFVSGSAPQQGQLYGLTIAVNDRDNEIRKTQLLWRYAPNHWEDTSGFGDLKLLAQPSLSSVLAAPSNLSFK